jgi:hypothetical protein
MDLDTLISVTLLCGMSGLILMFVPIADGIYRAGRVPLTRTGRERYRRYDRVGRAFACVGCLLILAFVAGVARLAGLI